MKQVRATRDDRFCLVHPAVDAHTLGITSVSQLLTECGHRVLTCGATLSRAFGRPDDRDSVERFSSWLRENNVTLFGLSYRLDPADGVDLVGRLIRRFSDCRLFAEQGGPIRAFFFAGLPETCRRVKAAHHQVAAVFAGDETPTETLRLLGVDPQLLPHELTSGMEYDEARLSFGRELIRQGDHLAVMPVDRSGYPEYGTARDTLVARLRHGLTHGLPPLVRAHVGPYLPDRREAVRLFLEWTRRLAATGLLDVLSIGTSQLTQSRFGDDWTGLANGGGVPLNAPEEYEAVWEAARPMLVRTYAGTRDVRALARMYEERLHIAWHALSLWWFCLIDGRGPNPLRESLREHLETIGDIASAGTPLEANVSHHFAFRGGDDVTYVVAAVLAARAAKARGIRHFVLQTMLNTPKTTWGVQDLAKTRSALRIVRELEDDRFTVVLQPRGGLDYFSPDLERAKAQLAAVTALMDDIEPDDSSSPPLIHVVSYCEASHLADPDAVDESIRITRHALETYRRLRAHGEIDDMSKHADTLERTEVLTAEAREVLATIERTIPDCYSADGLYSVMALGFLPVPYLWECREELSEAVRWPTRPVRGGVRVTDEEGRPLSAPERMRRLTGALR